MSNNLDTDIRTLARYINGVLQRDSRYLLKEVADQVKLPKLKWRVVISRNEPLIFGPAEIDNRLQPDLYCSLMGPGQAGWPVEEQSLTLRIWSLDKELSYRGDWDSPNIDKQLEPKQYRRVIMRFHFDKACQKEKCPQYHLQFGGIPIYNEFHWLPNIDFPRLPYPPMDIVLACELVIANFFPTHFYELNNTPEWLAIVIRAQDRILSQYYKICHNMCSIKNQSLLQKLWDVEGH